MKEDTEATRTLERQLQAELARLHSQESSLIDLATDGTLPRTTIRERINEIHAQSDRLTNRLHAVRRDLTDALAYIDAALELLDNAGSLYAAADDAGRQALNQALFEKLLVEEDEVINAIYTEEFAGLIQQQSRAADLATHETQRAAPGGGSAVSMSSEVLDPVHCDEGSSSDHLVDLMRAYFKTAQAPLTPVDLAHLAARIAHGEKVERSDPARQHRLIARLGTEICDEICRRYEQGESTIALAKSYDASKPAILTLLRSRGITVRSITITPEQLQRAVDLYEAGKSVAQVGVELGFSASGIWRALKANGVQMRARGF